MGLADTLSALRELILEQPLCGDAPESLRLELLRQRFPNLSTDELEDLAKIPPEKLKKYTTSISSGSWDVIKSHLPMTVELIGRAWRAANGERFNSSLFLNDMRRHLPWRGFATVDLLRTFITYSISSNNGISTLLPFLGDLGEFEVTTLECRRSRGKSRKPHSNSNLINQSLSQLLALSVEFNSTCSTRSFSYDIPTFARSFDSAKRSGDDIFCPASRGVSAICVRSYQEGVQWVEVETEIAELVVAGKQISVENLASAYLSVPHIATLSEREQAENFVALFAKLFSVEVLCITDSVEANI